MPNDFSMDPQERLADGGPRYVETPADPRVFPGYIAEPWNTASAFLFILIAVGWLIALRGRYRKHPLLTCCIPILLTGGIGGTLYHGIRLYHAFFLMDVIPIYILGLVVAIYLWIRLGPKVLHLIGMIGFLVLLQSIGIYTLPRQWAINVSYAALALLMVIPIALVLVRTKFMHGGWILTALGCFGIAWICRIADTARPPLLPMGTHWLWHLFGALTTCAVSYYVYRIEGMKFPR